MGLFKTHRNKTATSAFLFGLILNVTAYLIFSLVASAIISSTDNPTASIGIAAMISMYMCAAFCGFTVSKYKGNGGMLPAISSSLLFVLAMLLIGLITTKGALPLINVINYAVYVILCSLFAFVASKRINKRRR